MGRQFPEVERLIRRLRTRGLRVERAVLFGSRSRGDWLRDSDVDLLLVSRDFEGVFFTDRAEKVLGLWDGKVSLEPICLTPEEFEERRGKITVIREAVRTGKTIYPLTASHH